MESNRKFLLNILCSSIGRRMRYSKEYEKLNLEKIFEDACNHSIHSLVYPELKKHFGMFGSEQPIIDEWRKTTIASALGQRKFVSHMGKVFCELNKQKLEFIVLKGLVVRELYPHPEFRTMSDADILIHKHDFEKTKAALSSIGYSEYYADNKHSIFIHDNYYPVEVHWTIIDDIYIKNCNQIEKEFWNKADMEFICDEWVLSLCLENNILYLVIHMASHIVYSGFGLRQLCDFILLIDHNKEKINWGSVYKDAVKCNMLTFMIAIFEICRRLFLFEVPKIFFREELKDSSYIEMLQAYIFSGGVYGTKNLEKNNDNEFIKENYLNSGYSFGRIKYTMHYIFPGKRELDIRYSYAQKQAFLLPIAWIHRILHNFFNMKVNVSEKKVFLNCSASISEKRCRLFRWLELI